MSAVAPSRVERMRDVEAAVRLFRWFAVAFAAVQISVLYAPPPGVEIPFPRLPAAAAFAVPLVLLNLLSYWSSRSDDVRVLRASGALQLVVDTALVIAILVLFSFDHESRLWPLFVLPVLEGAMREQMRGALLTVVASAGLIAWHNSVFWDDPLPNVISGVAFQGGVLLAVGLGAGALARRFENARLIAEESALRLRELAELSQSLVSRRRSSDLLVDVLEAAEELTAADSGEVYVRSGDAWERRAAHGDEDDMSLLEHLLVESQLDDIDEMIEVSTPGPQILATPVVHGGRAIGLLVLARREHGTEPFSKTDHDVLGLLAAHAAVALQNARLAEEEQRTIEELRALDAVKDEFVTILAHELRGPMSTLRGYASLLRTKWQRIPDSQREEFLDVIERGSQRLANLVRDIQEVTEADRRALPIEARTLDLRELIEEVGRAEVGASDPHRLEIAVASDTPLVRADPDRVAQVLSNLVSNAVKYSPDGGRIRIEVRPEGELVAISITDDGIGIPPHLLRHLFQKFSRLPTPKRLPGTGLGLYLTRKLVEAMGGTITVESEQGRGSTFTFTLPTAADPSVEAAHVDDVAGVDTDAPIAGTKD